MSTRAEKRYQARKRCKECDHLNALGGCDCEATFCQCRIYRYRLRVGQFRRIPDIFGG